MNQLKLITSPATNEAVEARFALRLTTRLDDGTRSLPQDVTERLRFAREQALARARQAMAAPTIVNAGRGASALLGGAEPGQWWLRLASVMPLIALVGGLVLIQRVHQSSQVVAAAEVDAALLADEVPPAAYIDPGFVEFLKTPLN